MRQGVPVETTKKCEYINTICTFTYNLSVHNVNMVGIYFYILSNENENCCPKIVDEAGSNKQHAPSRNTTKLDQETEELRHDHIGLDVGRLIQQGRQQKSLTQKDLATVSNVQLKSINMIRLGFVDFNLQNSFLQFFTLFFFL